MTQTKNEEKKKLFQNRNECDTRGRGTKIEKIWVPYEKSNLIPFNFAEVIINNDQLQQHPTPKSHNLNFESFIVQGYP